MRQFAAEPPIEERIGDALRTAGHTVAVAESCTGGLIGSLLTDVPGSSTYFDRSMVTYSYDAKRQVLAVDREVLETEGAVSEPVARQMAKAVRDTAETDWGISTTGIAGPEGGSDEKPVGTVFIGIAYAGDWGTGESETRVEHFEFDGGRLEIKERIARVALSTLLESVEDAD